MLKAKNIRYDLADRARAVACGGIGVAHLLAQRVGLPQAIDQNIHVLKKHLPYHESDHVLTLAYNILADGHCIEDLEHLRTNEAILDALGAKRIPDPTTAGDFCRRFQTDQQVLLLMNTFNQTRLKVWKQQDAAFFEQAILDADGTIAPTFGECKEGMDISYDGQWGYHPLLISLANTKEPLYLVNRSGNRPSHEQADDYLDKAAEFCLNAGFKKILLRGDTDFTQTWKLDGWDQRGNITFIFGADANKYGVWAMRNPLDNLHSNWAYMVMSSLAWTLKAWCGLLLPVSPGPWEDRHKEQKRSIVRMEFKTFLGAMMRLPAQIVRTGRRIVYRLMSWNPWTGCLLRLAEAMHRPLRC